MPILVQCMIIDGRHNKWVVNVLEWLYYNGCIGIPEARPHDVRNVSLQCDYCRHKHYTNKT